MQKPDESICVYGAGILKKSLEAFQEEITGVRQAEDIEYIHRMRVASRRLRSALPLFINCYKKQVRQTWQDDIHAITRALGAARDTDVQIDYVGNFLANLPEEKHKPGVRRLLLRLRQKRQKMQVKVIKALDRLEHDKLTESMQKQVDPLLEKTRQVYMFSPGLYQLSFDAVSVVLDQFLSYEPYIARVDCVEELHAMRIAAKQLRYTLEVFTSLYPGELKQYLQIMKQVQDLLGTIHDNDIWGQLLPQFIADESTRIRDFYGSDRSIRRLLPGLESFLAQTRSIRGEKYNEFNESWKRWKKEQVWPSLKQTIQTSFLEANPIPLAADIPPTTSQEPAA
ncbi:MAG: CHAD domain-containing protein [Anaerolineaceae bacterium]